jgi:cysteinyl-tRNA synthetase
MSAPHIRLYNTLTQSVEPLVPMQPGEIRLYGCGLTTYDHAHIGHARANAAYDVLVRFLRARGFRVTYVRNITDVDDKILKRAGERGEDPLAFSQRMAKVNDEELASVGCMAPDNAPKVSEHMPEILALIEALIAKGVAYVAKTDVGQDVYFAVRSFPDYGKLSKRKLDDLLAGARVDVGETKRDPLDFALWKGDDTASFGWPSPWGKGRPGWHIECSAMAAKYLGPHFDIHCGGSDLIFPHHENEIAQSEAAWGKDFARHWFHVGFLTVDQEKMSKSLGNFVTIADAVSRNDGEAVRYFLLGTHYRAQLSFDLEKREDGRVVFPGLDEAERRVEYLYGTREALTAAADGREPLEDGAPKALAAYATVIREAREKVLSALDKDLNTPVALSVIAELAKSANELVAQIAKLKKDPKAQEAARGLAAAAKRALDGACEPLGLLQAPAEEFFARSQARRLRLRKLDASAIESKIAERAAARDAKDFARSDAIRAELTALGVELLDGPSGTTWKVLVG